MRPSSLFGELVSAIAVLALHLQKWDLQPERHSQSCMTTLNRERGQILDLLGETQALKSRLQDAVEEGNKDGRNRPVIEKKLACAMVFLRACPSTFEEMLKREIVSAG